MIGASAAATIAGLPFLGPIAAARVGFSEGEFILNPTKEELNESELDLNNIVTAGIKFIALSIIIFILISQGIKVSKPISWVEVKNFPAFVVIDNKGNDFFDI